MPLPADALLDALARTAAAVARLDQALNAHPLLSAFLHRTRLDAVRRQAAVDGYAIDPWHLAATLEGLRFRLDGAARIIDRGAIFAAAHHALALHQWLVGTDFDQEGEVQRAGQMLANEARAVPLLAAADGVRTWIEGGESRPAMRGALVRFWTGCRVLEHPIPLTGAAAFRAEQAWEREPWTVDFLHAVAGEAEDWLDLLFEMERVWLAARRSVAGRRRNSRASLAIDVMAGVGMISATTLASAIDMSIKNAGVLLDRFCADGVAVEVTHRSARRLFGLTGLAPLREVVRPPRRPEPGRGRGRPRLAADDPDPAVPQPPIPAIARFERPAIDYDALDAAMAIAEQTIRRTRHNLAAIRAESSRLASDDQSHPAAAAGDDDGPDA